MSYCNVFLIGFMGSGKSTVGAALRDCCSMELVDMDERIALTAGLSIPQIFSQYGEEYFRGLETRLLKELSRQKGLVVSCGGGAPLRPENVAAMKAGGIVVLLEASPSTVYERVKNDTNRPLLKGHMDLSYIRDMMEKRLPLYEAAADLKIPTDDRSISEICEEIQRRLT